MLNDKYDSQRTLRHMAIPISSHIYGARVMGQSQLKGGLLYWPFSFLLFHSFHPGF
jgi:hypothetical protein